MTIMTNGTIITNNTNASFSGSSNHGLQAGHIEKIYMNIADSSIGEEIKKKQKESVIQWLSPLDFCKRSQEILERHHPKTGRWLLNDERYEKWKDCDDDDDDGADPRTLLMHGIQGAGKSVLSSLVVNELSKSSPRNAVLCIYCSHDNREMQTCENLIGSLLRQTVSLRKTLSQDLNEFYQEFNHRRPPRQQVMEKLVCELRSFYRVFIVVDGIDECADTDERQDPVARPKRELIENIKRLLRQARNTRILITSRSDPLLKVELSSWPDIEVEAQPSDIAIYLESKIKANPRVARFNQKDLIKKKITEKSLGMFLLANRCWDLVSEALTLGELRQKLEILPCNLTEMYKSSMSRIKKQPESHVNWALATLSWVFSAIRPLAADEIRYAMAISMAKSSRLDEEWLPDQNDLASICKGFIIIEKSGTIRFAHKTVKEFFDLEQKEGRLFVEASEHAALTCLECLTLDDFATGPLPKPEEMTKRTDRVPFLRYAATYWFRHSYKPDAVKGNMATLLRDAQAKLLTSPDRLAYLNWLRIHQPDPSQSWLGECPWLSLDEIPPQTFYTTLFGLTGLTAVLEANAEGTEQLRSMKIQSLCGAVRGGDIPQVKRLLSEGLCKDFKDDEGVPLLIICGSPEMQNFLLDNGADVNATSDRGWNALQCYARGGDLDGIKMLHRQGAHIPPEPGEESALHHAVNFGHLEAARYLLANGAKRDVNANGEVGPLGHWAAKHGQAGILKLLVDNGCDLEVRDTMSEEGGCSVLEWFLGHGWCYCVQGEPSGWGMGSEHKEVAEFLLGSLSLEQLRSSRGPADETLLHWCMQKGYQGLVERCLEKGVGL